MTTEASDPPSSKRVLEPIERISEVLFGLIMVLTFTGSFKAGSGDGTTVRKMLLSALGCNLVWGIIDGIMYLMGCLAEKARGLAAVRAVRAADPAKAQKIIAAALPPVVASLLKPPEFEAMRQELSRRPEFPARPELHARDWLAAICVCLLVFASTFPVVLPFIFMQNALAALRVSNAVALAMLFITGYAFALCTGFRGWVMGLGMMAVGLVLASLAMMAGG